MATDKSCHKDEKISVAIRCVNGIGVSFVVPTPLFGIFRGT